VAEEERHATVPSGWRLLWNTSISEVMLEAAT